MRRTSPLVVLIIAAVVALPAAASASITYSTGVGFRQPEFVISHNGGLVPEPINVDNYPAGSNVCPATGPNGLCLRLISNAGLSNGRLFLKSGVRFKRTQADAAHHENAA